MTDDQEDALQALADQAQALGMYDVDPPMVVYVYRYKDGRTAVRAPETQDHELVKDMLEEAVRAMDEGKPVIRQ